MASDYYDLHSNIISSIYNNDMGMKILEYPGIIKDMYYITKDGKIYSGIDNSYISWRYDGKFPYVNLSYNDGNGLRFERFYIKDLMAYNYILDKCNYLERGYHSANIDGNPSNCNYKNIRYINPLQNL